MAKSVENTTHTKTTHYKTPLSVIIDLICNEFDHVVYDEGPYKAEINWFVSFI